MDPQKEAFFGRKNGQTPSLGSQQGHLFFPLFRGILFVRMIILPTFSFEELGGLGLFLPLFSPGQSLEDFDPSPF